jgi:hypothetical protein
MRHFMKWERGEPDAFREFVLWTVRNPTQDVGAFLRSHAHEPILDEVVRDHLWGIQSFMAWCRLYPAAAENLVSYPEPLEWVGDHLYRL